MEDVRGKSHAERAQGYEPEDPVSFVEQKLAEQYVARKACRAAEKKSASP